MVTTLLVANRGEIARRIFRTARRMNMRTVAVYSDADANEPFVREADVALRIGPPPAAESYLDIERVITAAREAEADLVHPGYGFLAESPKALAQRARVPVLPGYMDADQRDEAFIAAATRIGYPVMVKPVAGGGGIGMLRVREPSALQDALAKSRRIASASFGDERLMLEKLVERPRHVEVQLLADTHGQIFALGERDCSTQRRHQKILEETPAPSLEDAQRKALAEAAIAIAREAKYTNAGTAEFIVDAKGRFAFLEVNARLQVEHPVTELVWDIDLVEQQLRVAMGERLSLREPAPRGHAIEVRLYAEDVEGGFLPATGRIAHIRWPEGIRVDAGYEEGSTVTRHYDPLIAKLIAHGPHRKLALAKLCEALAQMEVLGVRTNLRFLRALTAHDGIQKGKSDTEFVKRSFEELVPERPAAPDEAYVLAAATVIAGARDPRDPWTSLGPWRLGEGYASTVTLREGDAERMVRLTGRGPYELNGHVAVRSQAEPHEWNVELTIGSEVAAPMPGVVIALQTKPDQKVRRGDLLFVVEAMKMELRVEAPADGVVRKVLASVGQQVERGQRLAEFEPQS
ncbi:MAG: ATP-grasp domain-containing protein [Chloroflexi bacterium]|nr:MAG: ATP-grasp domain-containing protein [Chloroflexota bacterium]